MTIFRSDTLRNAIIEVLDAQRGASCKVQIRSGAPSGTPGGGTLLAELIGDGTDWAGAASAGVLTSNAITADASADNGGTAAHYELLTTGSTWLEAGICNAAGTDGVTIDNETIAEFQTVQMSGNWVNTAAYDDAV